MIKMSVEQHWDVGSKTGHIIDKHHMLDESFLMRITSIRSIAAYIFHLDTSIRYLFFSLRQLEVI